jgi:5'-nucleotidase (lipoprotein e(P4) family)
MMKKIIIFAIFLSFCTFAFSQSLDISENEHLTMSTLWFQKSAEMHALYYQAFNIATLRLEQKLENANPEKKYAVVCDIDETLVDNSPFEGKCILENFSFSDSLWYAWTSLEIAEALPGALEFAQFAASKGVIVFYVSNRKVIQLEATMNNMKNLGFPNIEEQYFLLKTTTSDKEERRNSVSEEYEILLYCGDNLGDFSNIFDNRKDNYGIDLVIDSQKMFGDQFIVLPNPMYGAWENAIYNGNHSLKPSEKNKLRKELLKSF